MRAHEGLIRLLNSAKSDKMRQTQVASKLNFQVRGIPGSSSSGTALVSALLEQAAPNNSAARALLPALFSILPSGAPRKRLLWLCRATASSLIRAIQSDPGRSKTLKEAWRLWNKPLAAKRQHVVAALFRRRARKVDWGQVCC